MAVSSAQLKRLQEQVKKLRLENARLKKQLRGTGKTARLVPVVADPHKRTLLLKSITQRMKQNPIPKTAKYFTREELHERN